MNYQLFGVRSFLDDLALSVADPSDPAGLVGRRVYFEFVLLGCVFGMGCAWPLTLFANGKITGIRPPSGSVPDISKRRWPFHNTRPTEGRPTGSPGKEKRVCRLRRALTCPIRGTSPGFGFVPPLVLA